MRRPALSVIKAYPVLPILMEETFSVRASIFMAAARIPEKLPSL
jgi:hypothetical protein